MGETIKTKNTENLKVPEVYSRKTVESVMIEERKKSLRWKWFVEKMCFKGSDRESEL